MRRFLLALILIGLALLPAPARAQESPLDLGRYEALLREARAAAARGDQIDLRAAAEPLIAARSVALPGGGSAPVDNSWLAAALQRDPPDTAAVAARLGALIDALAYPGDPAPADARARLEAILSRPPFGQDEPSEPSWLERFLEWLADLLGDMVVPAQPAAAGAGGGAWISWAIAGVGGLLVIGVLVFWLRGLRHTLAGEARLRPDDPEANLSAGDALQRAGDLARDGDYRTAVRFLYLSSLLWLDERGALRYDRSLTNREYLARLAGRPELRAQLAPVVETFDRVWYGHLPLDAESFAEYERQVAAVREAGEPKTRG